MFCNSHQSRLLGTTGTKVVVAAVAVAKGRLKAARIIAKFKIRKVQAHHGIRRTRIIIIGRTLHRQNQSLQINRISPARQNPTVTIISHLHLINLVGVVAAAAKTNQRAKP